MTRPVAALFVRADSVYKTMVGVDCYDIDRNALTWPGGCPVVAHPPCRAWGGLSHMAKPRPGERELALWAVDQVRSHGGVLEHPRTSRLWAEKPLPAPGAVDAWGGWTLPVWQWWWGHRAAKATYLYIVGARPEQLPEMPYRMGTPTHVIAASRNRQRARAVPEVTKSEREHTPPQLAEWLVEVARRCTVPVRQAA